MQEIVVVKHPATEMTLDLSTSTTTTTRLSRLVASDQVGTGPRLGPGVRPAATVTVVQSTNPTRHWKYSHQCFKTCRKNFLFKPFRRLLPAPAEGGLI